MRKFLISIFTFLILTAFSFGVIANDNNIYVIDVFTNQAIAGSGDVTSSAINLNSSSRKIEGFFSIQITTAGAASTVTVDYYLSYDNITFVNYGTDIVTDMAVGTNMYAFPDGEPVIAPYIKIRVTETAGNPVTSCNVKLCVQ